MSPQNESGRQHEEEEEEQFSSAGIESSPSAWKAAWQNNKGMFLILLSEIAGSSMDAIVRFLQQGGHGMHPFQVRTYLPFQNENSLHTELTPPGHLCSHGDDVHPEHHLHVVDQSP
jgi:hypothetical protein